jgi:hypothetical protein
MMTISQKRSRPPDDEPDDEPPDPELDDDPEAGVMLVDDPGASTGPPFTSG